MEDLSHLNNYSLIEPQLFGGRLSGVIYFGLNLCEQGSVTVLT